MQIIQRVFGILECFKGPDVVPFKDIVEHCNLKKTTTANIVAALVREGVLQKVENGKYSLASRIKEIAGVSINKESLLNVARDYCQALGDAVNETVSVSVLSGLYRKKIAQFHSGRQLVVQDSPVVTHIIVNCATGMVLLSYSSKSYRDHIITIRNKEIEQTSRLDFSRLNEEFDRIQKEQYAIVEDEEVVHMAVPVFDASGNMCCSMGMTVPAGRARGEKCEVLLCELRHAGKSMSETLKLYDIKIKRED